MFSRLLAALRREYRRSRDIKVWMGWRRLHNGGIYGVIDPTTDSRTSADGIRCDDGNVWAGARPGVQIVAPDGDTIGVIRLPEVCANVCFGGAKRNRLFMTTSQSLYSVYVGVRGAGVAWQRFAFEFERF